MNNETNSSNPAASVLSGDAVASAYITAEVEKARKDLKRTRIVGFVLVGVVGTYITFISSTLVGFFQPRQAAQVASGMILQHLASDGTALATQMEKQVPQLIRQLPDYAIEQLPQYRNQLEATVETELRAHCKTLSKDIGMQVDNLIDAHHDDIKELLAHANDRAALRKALPDLDAAITNYLLTDPDGRTIHHHIGDLAAELHEVEARLGRLAYGNNLSPEEQKARYTVAVLARAINNHLQDAPAAAPAGTSRKLASK